VQKASIKKQSGSGKGSPVGEHRSGHAPSLGHLFTTLPIETALVVFYVLLKAGLKWLVYTLHMQDEAGVQRMMAVASGAIVAAFTMTVAYELLNMGIWMVKSLWRSIKED